MKCNRTACKNEHDGWFNEYTLAYYCTRCARKINESSMKNLGKNICVLEQAYADCKD